MKTDYKKYEINNIKDLNEKNIIICSVKFDLEQFLENYNECQMATIIITPKQIVTAYSGDSTNLYHASFANEIKCLINQKNIFTTDKHLHYIDIYIRTGSSYFAFLCLKHSKVITETMYDTIEEIYEVFKKFKNNEFYITSLDEFKKEIKIIKKISCQEKIIGIPIDNYLKKDCLQPKLYKKQLKVGRMQP